jgi:uncharacterized BrkB/YihY/UPF0761 family membrane protein
MGYFYKYVPCNEGMDPGSSMKFIGLFSLIPIVISCLLICSFPLQSAITATEHDSVKSKTFAARSDTRENRMPHQPLESISIKEKFVLLYYVALGKSLRELKAEGKKGKTQSHRHD